jgi:CheY-like chemotaxis protein
MSESTEEYRVLCVDDEPRVLDGIRRTLGMNFHVTTAEGGERALALLDGPERFAVTVSDMRMPGMDGATYLERAAEKAPDMVRLLLTGQAELQAAIRAINLGRIFRFLTKPCDAETLQRAVEDAVEQHRLIRAEKELLEQTVYGCVNVLTEMLSLVNPVAFARAGRIKRIVQSVARRLDLKDAWQLELAVMLSHLGYVGIAPELLDRAYTGKPVTDAERQLLGEASKTAHKLLSEIPRIEAVLAIIAGLGGPRPSLDGLKPSSKEGRIAWGVHVIHAAERADELSYTMPVQHAMIEAMVKEKFNTVVLAALGRAELVSREQRKHITIAARDIEPGMFLVEDAVSHTGVLMAKGGQEVTRTIAVLLKRMSQRNNLKEPLTVSVAEGGAAH